MIQQAHLTAWQTHAPWDKRSKVEQDLRLARGVAAIFADDVLAGHLAMRGGTVLLKPMEKDALDSRLRRVLTPVLGEPSDSVIADAWLALRNVVKPSKILRTVYSYVPLGLRYPMKIKVEVNLNESAALFPMVDVSVALLDEEGELTHCRARSYDLDEMLGTKMRALLQRTQGRDLFDLYHSATYATTASPPCTVDGARAIQAFDWYLENEGTRMDRDEAERLLEQRRLLPAFRKDTNTLLRSDFGYYDIDAVATLVREQYFRHLRSSPAR